MHTGGCRQSLLGASPRRAGAPHPSPQEPRRRQGWPARHPPCRSAGLGGPHPAPAAPAIGVARRKPLHRGRGNSTREVRVRPPRLGPDAGRGAVPSARPTAGRRGSRPTGGARRSRPSRSAAAVNARKRSVASSDRVGRGAVATRAHRRGAIRANSPPQRATWSVSSSRGACSTHEPMTVRKGSRGTPVSSQRP